MICLSIPQNKREDHGSTGINHCSQGRQIERVSSFKLLGLYTWM